MSFDIFTITGFAGTLFSFIVYFLPEKHRGRKWVLISIVGFLMVLSVAVSFQYNELKQRNDVAKAAALLIEHKDSNYTTGSFIQAALTFLEYNKSLHPDAYERAKAIQLSLNKDSYASEWVDASSEIEGIIKGIAILHLVKE